MSDFRNTLHVWLVVFRHPSEKYATSSIGMMIEPQYFWENKKWQPNHQPVMVSGGLTWFDDVWCFGHFGPLTIGSPQRRMSSQFTAVCENPNRYETSISGLLELCRKGISMKQMTSKCKPHVVKRDWLSKDSSIFKLTVRLQTDPKTSRDFHVWPHAPLVHWCFIPPQS